MHLLTLSLSLLAVPALSSPLTTRTCAPHASPQCIPQAANLTIADLAFTRACQQVPVCVPGVTFPKVSDPILGKVPGYTALLAVGPQCAGYPASEWSLENCKKLFGRAIDEPCQAVYPRAGLFVLGYTTYPCDGTRVSFNFGG